MTEKEAKSASITQTDHHFAVVVPKGTSGDIELEEAWLQRMADIFILFCGKQNDYGPGNIAAAGQGGVLVRMRDKFERLNQLLTGAKAPANETIQDTIWDIADYAIILDLVRDGEWPDTEKQLARCPTCGK